MIFFVPVEICPGCTIRDIRAEIGITRASVTQDLQYVLHLNIIMHCPRWLQMAQKEKTIIITRTKESKSSQACQFWTNSMTHYFFIFFLEEKQGIIIVKEKPLKVHLVSSKEVLAGTKSNPHINSQGTTGNTFHLDTKNKMKFSDILVKINIEIAKLLSLPTLGKPKQSQFIF